MARSLEVVENQEAGHGRPRRGSTPAQFSEGEGSETEATWIVDQILARLGPGIETEQGPEETSSHSRTPGLQVLGAWSGKCLPLPRRNFPRTKVPKRQGNETEGARHLQIEAGQETLKGDLNVTSAQDTDTS